MSDPVLDLLNKKGMEFKPSGRDYLVKCFNPEHEDNNPSCRVDKVSGIFNCLSCGYKGNIFKYFGILTNFIPIKIAALKEKILLVKQASTGLDPLPGSSPYSRPIRGISVSTLKHFEAFTTSKVQQLEDRIVFPIKDIRGKTVVYVGRHTLSNANPRYINYPSSVSMPLYPITMPKGSSTAVLVEGLFDMLNLYDRGMHNVICCFGTQTITHDLKNKLMPLRAQGVYKIFILFDGDEAGRKAAYNLTPLIEAEGFVVERIDLPDGTDPGELGEEDANSLIEYTK